VFQIREEEGIPTFVIAESDQEQFWRLTGENIKPDSGQFLKLDLLNSGSGKYSLTEDNILYDFFCDGILVSPKLKKELEEFLSNVGYWIEFQYEGNKYHYFHTTKVMDAIDYKASGCRYIEGFLASINPIVFNELDYTGSPLFRVPREDGKPIWLFTSDLFFSKLNELGFEGVKARKPQI